MHKVKYTRKEYREDFLKDPIWINLRDQILSTKPNCQCCTKLATDVHHLVYRNLVDITIADLLPLCRDCHDLIHQAISDKWISQDPAHLAEITATTRNIQHDVEYAMYHKWLNEKHLLSEDEQTAIKSLQAFVIKKISGLVHRNVWYDKLHEMKFTGRHILQIRKIINLSLMRRLSGLDKMRPSVIRTKRNAHIKHQQNLGD